MVIPPPTFRAKTQDRPGKRRDIYLPKVAVAIKLHAIAKQRIMEQR